MVFVSLVDPLPICTLLPMLKPCVEATCISLSPAFAGADRVVSTESAPPLAAPPTPALASSISSFDRERPWHSQKRTISSEITNGIGVQMACGYCSSGIETTALLLLVKGLARR